MRKLKIYKVTLYVTETYKGLLLEGSRDIERLVMEKFLAILKVAKPYKGRIL